MFFKNLWSAQGNNSQKYHDYLQYTSSEKALTPVNQLEIGMYVVELDRPWLETPFLFQGFELRTEAQIQTVKITVTMFISTKPKRALLSELFLQIQSIVRLKFLVIWMRECPP